MIYVFLKHHYLKAAHIFNITINFSIILNDYHYILIYFRSTSQHLGLWHGKLEYFAYAFSEWSTYLNITSVFLSSAYLALTSSFLPAFVFPHFTSIYASMLLYQLEFNILVLNLI